MSTKTGLLAGFAAGYILGSKAGRERYQQIEQWWNKFAGNPKVQQLTDRGKELAGEAGRRGMGAVQGGVTKASSAVRNRLGETGESPDWDSAASSS
jgi:hypothetical protein